MNLKDQLVAEKLDPQRVLVLRHRPLEPEFNKVLPWLAAERPDVFNAYQQTQTKQVEVEMARATLFGTLLAWAGILAARRRVVQVTWPRTSVLACSFRYADAGIAVRHAGRRWRFRQPARRQT